MIQESNGIVFRSNAYSETSLIVDIYTEDFGLVSCIVSGVRRQKARMHANVFQIMSLLEFIYYDKPGAKSLCRIKEAKPSFIYQKIPFTIARLAIGQFMIEVLQKSIKERETNKDLYDFITDSFVSLDSIEESNLPYFHLCFLIELSRFLGFYPDNNWSEKNKFFDPLAGRFTYDLSTGKHTINETESQIISYLLSKVSVKRKINLRKQERLILLNHILFFYRLHVERFPDIKSFDILKQIFS